MAEIWTSLIPILIADLLNPVLFAFMVYAAGTDRPIVNSSAMLLGHTVAYLAVGIVLSFGLEAASYRLANPKRIDFFIEVIVGVILLWVAWRSRSAEDKDPVERTTSLSPLSAFGFGMVVNFIGIPFAVPYFAALSQILKTDPSFLQAFLMLFAYNVLYALPFAIVPSLVAVMGPRSRPVLQKINGVLNRISAFLMPIILALVGLALLADAITYFWTGSSLF
ncbi:MAG: GAP family protein [Arenicellales bacterium]|nr:GAP family protein [Arenicellales bacterium]